MAKIVSVNKLLKMQLNIPPYQRPYKWSIRNMEELLSDISNAITYSKEYSEFKYRIGTVILHRDRDNDTLNIVDGQQRIISLILLNLYLDNEFECTVMNKQFTNKISQTNIHSNYMFVREWFSLKLNSEEFSLKHKSEKNEFLKAMKEAMENTLEVVVIEVYEISEAFQLFDSQNTRGKALEPHDLLKAYHLREMRNYPYEMEHAVTKWEAKDTKKIHDLFDLYLFPVWNWSKGCKSRSFTTKEIDTYKGIVENSPYSYAKRASKAMPYFQITEPFIAGNDFFEMVDHYMNLLDDVQTEIDRNEAFKDLRDILEQKNNNSVGFKYAKDLFYCALLMYYDKFHNFDNMAVKKIFTWALMIRVHMQNLGFGSINKYAIGEANGKFSNVVPLFSRIALARMHTEISNIQIEVLRDTDKAEDDKWNQLYFDLKKMNGYGDK
ncbi:MAG: DUF262 domain-containing protein [Succinivibrio sp.]|nr:DUF262 domain-containing protein [Succinivibrio sp.]